jgi:nifR3 family TIM-barrel protein
LHIGPITLASPVVLAPMAGVTNVAFRTLCRELEQERVGTVSGLYVCEMVTARALVERHPVTMHMTAFSADEVPRSLQLYTVDPATTYAAVKMIADEGLADHVDMNFGCPVPKVTRCGGGSAIPVKPRLLARIVRAAVKSAGKVPVTIKVRRGIDESLLTFLDAGRVAEEEGARAIGLHARTAAQLYSGEALWDAIAELKASVRIPVLGNGDVWEWTDALAMMRRTGCDGVIVGRGCLGRPWLFRELAEAFDGREPVPPPDLGAIVAIMADHARRLVAFFGEETGMRQMRKWCGWYTKGFRGSASVRETLSRVRSIDEMLSTLAALDMAEPFPKHALRAPRGKSGSAQKRVALPEGYLDDRDDDTPPRSPHDAAEIEAWEQALSAG